MLSELLKCQEFDLQIASLQKAIFSLKSAASGSLTTLMKRGNDL